MMKLRETTLLISLLMLAFSLQACMDDDSFTTSPQNRLTFSTDTLSLDTIFANVPTTTHSFWAYNRSGDGLRCASVRLASGNQTGFRVNVNGTYLGSNVGYQAQDVEIRNEDSIRIFVELTAPATGKTDPQLVADDLVFTLESGVEQKVNLKAYAWDANLLTAPTITEDASWTGEKPIVIRGQMTISEGATLTLTPGTTLYFHENTGVDVYGRLVSQGMPGQEVVLRGDRLDRMFDYLPYDLTPGLWQGIRFHEESYDNLLEFTDLHSAFTGITCDSSDVSRQKLTLRQSTIHNCQGEGLRATHCKVTLENCQLSNTLSHCAAFLGGDIDINGCTLAQFYPFDIDRGAALFFSSAEYPLQSLLCRNSLVTGYGEDVMTGTRGTEENAFNYRFENCVIRTPQVAEEEASHFADVEFEDIADTTRYSEKQFLRIDTELLRYDFHLSEVSTAIGKANPTTAPLNDRDGKARDGAPDIGCYEREE